MAIYLLDNSLKVEICFDQEDCEFDDNIRVTITEECPLDEKIFIADQTNLYLTPKQAIELADALHQAAHDSRLDSSGI